MTRPTGIRVFQRLFRAAAGVDIDEQDIRRYRAFVDVMIDDLAITGRNAAKWSGRDVIAPADLPITKGLHERMREFDELDVAAEVRERPGSGQPEDRALGSCRRALPPDVVRPRTTG